jgi:mono/diheme cytochrome c family protein
MKVKTLVVLLCLLAGPVVAAAQTAVERGRYLVEGLGACANCHTPKGPQGPDAGKHLAGGFEIPEAFGVAVSPNITPDRVTGIGAWTDEQIIRAIREGKHRDGRTLGPPMPYGFYRGLSDTDVKAMVAYLRTVQPIENRVARSRYTTPLPPSWGPPVGVVPDVPRTDVVRYGAYLAGPVAHCMECHTPHKPEGGPDMTRLGAGGFAFRGPWGVSYAANLTSDPETGLGRWTDSEIVGSIHGARRGGGRVLPPMPVDWYVRGISGDDLKALLAYLRSLPPMKNAVPKPEPARRP